MALWPPATFSATPCFMTVASSSACSLGHTPTAKPRMS